LMLIFIFPVLLLPGLAWLWACISSAKFVALSICCEGAPGS
jgi:hypothetical protein